MVWGIITLRNSKIYCFIFLIVMEIAGEDLIEGFVNEKLWKESV